MATRSALCVATLARAWRELLVGQCVNRNWKVYRTSYASGADRMLVVFRDSAFADDVAKTNCAAILEQHGLTNVRSL